MAEPAKDDRAGVLSWYVLIVLTLVYVISFVDRQILSILAESIKLDLKLSDAQLGFLYGTAFAIFYAIFGIPLGRLADRWHRGWLVAIGLVGWSVMTSLSALATSFTLLALARTGVGIGEASTSPSAYSLIADYFPERRRATALSIYAAGLYIGLGLSLPVGGFLVSFWQHSFPSPGSAPFGLAPWQATFLLIGLPGLLMTLLVLTVKDPHWAERRQLGYAPWIEFGNEIKTILPPLTLLTVARRPRELGINLAILAVMAVLATALARLTGDVAQWVIYGIGIYAVASWVQNLRHRDAATYRLLWATPHTFALVVAFGGIALITYSASFWASPYALRTFYAAPTAPARLMAGATALQEVSIYVGWGSAIGSALGVILGGMVADRWRRRDRRGRLYTAAGSVLLSAPLVIAMFSTGDLRLFYILTPISTLFSSAWSGAAIATIQDLVLPRMRATAGATFLLGITLIGLALGPYITGKIGHSAGSLRSGIFWLYVVAPCVLVILWWVSRHLAALEDRRDARAEAATA